MSMLFATSNLRYILFLLLLFVCLSSSRIAFANLPAYDGKPGTTAGQKCVNPKDGAVMVWVPAGSFLMGSTGNTFSSEKPQHTITLDGYWIYQNDVTVAQYKTYCASAGEDMPKDAPAWGWKDTHPMVKVNWWQACAYAKWTGSHLPSEAQWEKAARGTDGRIYPWGNSWDADKCNNAATGPDKTMPVGSFPKGGSPYGCLDMAGNVSQWCEDWYNIDYYNNSPAMNPTGPKDGKSSIMIGAEWRVFRGGCWNSDVATDFRCADRGGVDPNLVSTSMGFRCVVSPPGP